MCRPPLVALLGHAPASAVVFASVGRHFLYRNPESLQHVFESADDAD
jgi:hypothetical protein